MRNINIKAVVKLTGINENTLRAWERRYQLVEPERSEDGHRLYSKKDIEKLSIVWRLVQEGHQISRLAELTMPQLRKLEEELGGELKAVSPVIETGSVAAEEAHLRTILSALKSFDLDALHRALIRAKFELSPRAIIGNLVLPLLREVGEQVAESKLSIAQEHLLSSLLRDHLGAWYQSLSPYDYKTHISQEKILVTTREGDLHEFAILLAAILCRLHGHETYYLGPNMPVADLARACEQFKITTVMIGLSELPKEKEFVKADEFLKELDRLMPQKIPFYYGGSAQMAEPAVKSDRKMVRFASLQELDGFLAKLI